VGGGGVRHNETELLCIAELLRAEQALPSRGGQHPWRAGMGGCGSWGQAMPLTSPVGAVARAMRRTSALATPRAGPSRARRGNRDQGPGHIKN
jgi:hypothetical protein